jgi:RimJ/RimL family protein N-acetyltransferase
VPFDLQPCLMSALLEVRPLAAEDYDDLYAAAADPLLWEQHPDKDRWRPEDFRSFFNEALASGGALTVVDAGDRRVIGSSRFHGHDEQLSEVEIGWTFLARSHWGGPYNGELKRLMLCHAFTYVSTAVFLVAPGNLRSQRAVEKIGAVPSGSRRDASGRQSLVYRLAARDWADAAAK